MSLISQVIWVDVRGGQGPRGMASGPLGASSVTSAEITSDIGEQLLIAKKIGARDSNSALLATAGVRFTGAATLAASESGLVSYESPNVRWYVGDGTGYSFRFSKRASSTTTDLIVITDAGVMSPGTDNTQTLGTSSKRWSTIYAGTGTINTSDEREKQQAGAIPDAWLDAWGGVEWALFKFNDAVAAKGASARWHLGMLAQQVRDAFAAHSLDARAIGLLCFDEWEADGESGAGDRWGLRYDECFAMEAAYQRRRMAEIEARFAALEA